jgi:hypothetical protein
MQSILIRPFEVMITFFTTFKTFNLAEQNAIGSWLSLHPSSQVLIFSESTLSHPLLHQPRVSIVSDFKKHNTGLPLINSMFEEASKLATHRLLCYLNSDIILVPEFVKAISLLLKVNKPFLAVSQRIDLDLTGPVNFDSPKSVEELFLQIKQNGKIHPATGSDIFIFPRHQYDGGNMPDLVVGRPGWDLWMIYNARLRFNRLIDITGNSPSVIHQNHPFKYHLSRPEDQMNLVFLPPGDTYTFVLKYCNFKLIQQTIHRVGVSERTIHRIGWELRFAKGTIDYYYYLGYFFFLRVKRTFFKKLFTQHQL